LYAENRRIIGPLARRQFDLRGPVYSLNIKIHLTMRIRIRGPSGASTLNLAEDSTVGDLRLQISEKTLLAKFDIKYGYPPKPLHLKSDDALLSSLDVRLDGEQLTVGSQEAPGATESVGGVTSAEHAVTPSTTSLPNAVPASVSFAMAGVKHGETSGDLNARPGKPVSLKRKLLDGDVPEQPLPERGATLGKRS
jgi:ubiquitin thioesterase OTU1